MRSTKSICYIKFQIIEFRYAMADCLVFWDGIGIFLRLVPERKGYSMGCGEAWFGLTLRRCIFVIIYNKYRIIKSDVIVKKEFFLSTTERSHNFTDIHFAYQGPSLLNI